MLEEIRSHPFFARAVSRGEQGVGRLLGQLLSNEKVTAGFQGLSESTRSAKRQIEQGMRRLLHALQIPTLEEIEALREKIGEIEAILSEMAERAEKGRKHSGRASGEQR